jgi:lysozyme
MPNLAHFTHGPDVYEGDGNIDWKAVAKAGARFGIIKLSEGDYIDKSATKARVDEMRKAGLIVGGYVFLRPKAGRNGAEEFDTMYKKGLEIGLWQRDKQRVRDLAPVLDCEASGFDTTTIRGRYQTRVYIRDAINRCIKVTGHRPIIYTGKWFWEDTINCKWSKACPLWLASYPTKPDAYEALHALWVPTAWKGKADLWQYTDQHKSPGIKTPCDYNIYVGKDRSYRAFVNTLTF